MLGLQQQQQKSRFKSGVSSKWEKTLWHRRSLNYSIAAAYLRFFPGNGSVVKAACTETRNQTVKAQRHLPMSPSCRTRERPVATNKIEEGFGSYAARLQQICFTMIRLLWIAMMIKILKSDFP
jgi:hypothetical protein